MRTEPKSARDRRCWALIATATAASRRMRLAGSAVLGISVAATLAVAASWITGFYVWEVAVPVLFGTITAGVLAGTVARGQSFAIDLNAARLELMLDRDPESRPSTGGEDVDS